MDGPQRSFLYTPGHRAELVGRVVSGELAPDVSILDLEDGVPAAQKDEARRVVAAALGAPRSAARRVVRISSGDDEQLARDLEAAVRPGLDGILVPKIARADELDTLDGDLAARERAAGLASGSIVVFASVESAAALIDAPRIARAPRVAGLVFGSEDFAADLGLPARREAEAADLLYARSAVVVAAVAAGKSAIDGIWADFADDAGLRADAVRGRRLGMTGRQCIHPGQVAIVNEIFTPSDDEVAHARRVIAAFEAGVARGRGAVALDGDMLDAPVVARARRTLAAVRALGGSPPRA